MDVKKFQDSRNSELDDFTKQYGFLKQQYSSALSSAIQEPDPEKQQELIQQVQQLNTQMADELRVILNTLNKGAEGFDPKTLDELTADLIQYQKDYTEIERTKDKVNTLKLIHTGTLKNLETATNWYYIFVGVLILLCFLVAFQVFKVPGVSWFTRTTSQSLPS
jgi:YesN/AraC family two-component response regulator